MFLSNPKSSILAVTLSGFPNICRDPLNKTELSHEPVRGVELNLLITNERHRTMPHITAPRAVFRILIEIPVRLPHYLLTAKVEYINNGLKID